MRQKKNELWRLDLLETKFFKAQPRLSTTKKLINARKNAQVLKKLPHSRGEAHKQIVELKKELLEKKWHGCVTKLHREVVKKVKTDRRSWKDGQNDTLMAFFASADNITNMINARLVKLFISAVLLTRDLKLNPPEYVDDVLRYRILNKSDSSNPLRFFIDHCQNDKMLNLYISLLWNYKPIKKLCGDAEWSFKKIRGNLSQEERLARAAALGRTKESKGPEGSEDSDDDDDDSENSEDSDSDSDSDSGSNSDSDSDGSVSDGSDESDESEPEMDPEEAFEKFASFDGMVAGSDDEAEFRADPNIDYNEITDEEPEESDLEEERKKREKAEKKKKKEEKEEKKKKKEEKKQESKLPSLAVGYLSGDSDDDDADNDKVAKEATTARKNRRGQRARQKIWEQKYGRNANHVTKEKQRIASERERKQQEFEERERKRQLKAQQHQGPRYNAPTPSSLSAGSSLATATASEHPSWVAKRKAEEKLKNVKFTGKKVKFD